MHISSLICLLIVLLHLLSLIDLLLMINEQPHGGSNCLIISEIFLITGASVKLSAEKCSGLHAGITRL